MSMTRFPRYYCTSCCLAGTTNLDHIFEGDTGDLDELIDSGGHHGHLRLAGDHEEVQQEVGLLHRLAAHHHAVVPQDQHLTHRTSQVSKSSVLSKNQILDRRHRNKKTNIHV